MSRKMLMVVGCALLVAGAYVAGTRRTMVAQAAPSEGVVPRSYGKIVTAISDSIGTGLVFEDPQGVIRFVSVTGMKEGELARYEGAPKRGGIPKSYGHLVSAVVNNGSTGLIFEDDKGVIRFLTITGVVEGTLTRE